MATAKLTLAPSFDAFLADPLGHYFVAPQLVAWAASPMLVGYTLWGRPRSTEVASLSRPIDLPRPQNIAPKCKVLLNVRRIEGVDFSAFDELVGMTRARLTNYENRIFRQAIVRPQGLIGAIAEGFGNLVAPQYSWRVVDSVEHALEWLDETPMHRHVDLIERIVDEVRGESPELVRLRNWFATQSTALTIDEVASGLHVSKRSLQRMLTAAGTSFREESERHVLTQALTYLTDTDDKIEVIARRLGFATASSFSVFFRRRTGQSPGQARGNEE